MCNYCYFNINDCSKYYNCTKCNIQFCDKCFKKNDYCNKCDNIVQINISKTGSKSSNLNEFIIVKTRRCFCFI